MKRNYFAIPAIVGLVLTLLPSILVFTGTISGPTHKILMLIGMLLWFSTGPMWIKRPGESS